MKNKNDSGMSNNSSQPLADIFSGLMLMFVLALMLVILYVSSKDGLGDYEGIGPGDELHDGDGDYGDYPGHGDDDDGDDGGGGYFEGDDELLSGDGLAAVRVVVIDSDTGTVIKSDGIDFNLYSDYLGDQITLNTYYPEKVSYTEFETVADGSFFFPEKIAENTYVLKNLTAPEGYISGGSVTFTVEQTYDWDDPYVVYFPLSMKNYSFSIHVTDKETGASIPGGEYEVYTADGEAVGTIVCDMNGYGQSGLLSPSSKYIIKQSNSNQFYSVLESPVIVTLDGTPDQIVEIKAMKTTFELSLIDELKKTPIEGASFSVYTENGEFIKEFKTNKYGVIKLQNLYKNTSYVIKQSGWSENWHESEYQIEISVDAMGRINGNSVYSETGTNRMIRADIVAEDKLVGFNIEGKVLILKNESGQIVHKWTSETTGTLIEGLSPGRYTLSEEGGASIEIIIEDTAEIQYFNYEILDTTTVIVYAVIAFFALTAFGALVALVIILIVKKKKRRKEGADYQ